MVSKKQIANGVAKFISNDLIPDLSEDMKFVMTIARKSIKENPFMLDVFLDNPMIASAMKKDGDMYDIDGFSTAMKNTLSEMVSYPITITKIPLLMNEDKTIKITADDIDRLYNYIVGEEIKPQ